MLDRIVTRAEMCSDYIWRLPNHGVLTYGEYKALETVIQWLRDFPEWIYANDTIKDTWLYGEIDVANGEPPIGIPWETFQK